ncbi:helix-turn-helix transcriptional regulator [Vagococcus silagei]
MSTEVTNSIKEIREARKIKQLDMAKELGVSRQTMTAIENINIIPV